MLFDRDNTLARTDYSLFQEAAQWIAEQHSLDVPPTLHLLASQWKTAAQRWWSLRTLQDEERFWQEYALELTEGLQIDAAFGPQVLERFPYERYLQPVEGAREVLEQLRGRGFKIGVLSNTLPSIERTMQALNLDDLVQVPLASCALGVHKPEPLAFELAAQALGHLPSEILMIDDKPENVEAARSVGMQAALIDLSGQEPAAIHNLHQVLELVS